MSRQTVFQNPQSRAGSLPVNELPQAQQQQQQSRRTASAASGSRPGSTSNPNKNNNNNSRRSISPLSKQEMFQQWGSEFRENPVTSKHTPGFSMERQVQREQRAKGMCRIADRVFQSLSYDPKFNLQDKHERTIDLRRHTGRKFDQSAGFFTPAGAHLTYHPEKAYKFLDLHTKGNVEFGRLPANISPQERQRAKYFEDAIVRRKFFYLHPSQKENENNQQQQQKRSSSAFPSSDFSPQRRNQNNNNNNNHDFYEQPCPIPKLTAEQKAQAAPPQHLFRSVRHTELAKKMSGSEVDGFSGSPEVVQAAINSKFCQRNKGHVMAGDCTREQRAKHGYESGKEIPLSCKMAPLVIRYSGVGGRGFAKYVPLGEMPKTQISFSKSPKLQFDRKDRDAIARTSIEGNSEVKGNAVKAFDFTKRKLFRNISFGPGFKSKNEDDF